MSPRHETRLREHSRSRSVELKKEHKSRSHHKTRSESPKKSRKKSKHTSSSRERKKEKKSKKSKKRKESSSSSSDSDEEELKLLQKLEAERLRLKEEKKKQKELMKANETPEEKRARRLREKQEKERKRRERMGWDNEYQCYTNQDNPFGDSALTNTFVWTKKLAKEGVKTVSREELEALNRQKQLENKIELEKVKRRRLEREAERLSREAEAGAAARAREAAQFSTWASHEDAFHLHQARLRSQIRIQDGRAKPIDLLAWYVSSEDCVDALEMHEPYTYLNGLQMQDLEDLLEDIKVYKELEKSAKQPYWEAVRTIVEDEVSKLRRVNAPSAQRDGVHQAVADDVTQIFKGKTGAQLEALQTQIEEKISGKRDGVDIGYWESLLSQLKAHMARARLRDRHQHNLRRKLLLLKQEQGVQGAQGGHAAQGAQGGHAAQEAQGAQAADAGPPHDRHQGGEALEPKSEERQPEGEAASGGEGEGEGEAGEEYRSGRYSPPLLGAEQLEPGTILTEEADDEQRLLYLRGRLHAANAQRDHANALAAEGGQGSSGGQALALNMGGMGGMGGLADGAPFGGEHALPEQPCLWADKYRPRKPRYFNRVHTGFEWNKYNQTHYDMDNPPPKIVQGYKFNIFYPDLIDKNATPEFSLKPCGDNPDFAVLRFHAGPPYEDIAFKIVNREWEYSYKRGFRCHFHNNIFQLWFHFKRYRYRR